MGRIALNYQNDGKEMLMNNFRFSDNGNSGYILKPRLLRDAHSNFDPNRNYKEFNAYKVLRLHIQIICGLRLPRSKNPYVHVETKGFLFDSATFTTSVIENKDNNSSCVWEESSDFLIEFPDFALLYFTLYNKLNKEEIGHNANDTELGYFGIPVSAIGLGYRNINLVDLKGQDIESASLLVKIERI